MLGRFSLWTNWFVFYKLKKIKSCSVVFVNLFFELGLGYEDNGSMGDESGEMGDDLPLVSFPTGITVPEVS